MQSLNDKLYVTNIRRNVSQFESTFQLCFCPYDRWVARRIRQAGCVAVDTALAGGGFHAAPRPSSRRALLPRSFESSDCVLRDDDAKIMAAEGFYYLLFDPSHSLFWENLPGAQVDFETYNLLIRLG